MRYYSFILIVILMAGCVTRRTYQKTQAQYQENLRKLVNDWYSSQLADLEKEKKEELIEATIALPDYQGIKGMKVLLQESVLRIEKTYHDRYVVLDSLREAKIQEIASSEHPK